MNAFNTLERDVFLAEAAKQPAVKLSYWAYKNSYKLRQEWHILVLTRSIAQGDPLGPWIFSLRLEALIASVRQLSPASFDVWYADDVALLGDRRNVLESFGLVKALKLSGLQINDARCRVLMQIEAPQPPGVQDATGAPMLVVLGYSVRSGGSSGLELHNAVRQAVRKLQKLESLGIAQGELKIMQYCSPSETLRHLLWFGMSQDDMEELRQSDHCLLAYLEKGLGWPLQPYIAERALKGGEHGSVGVFTIVTV